MLRFFYSVFCFLSFLIATTFLGVFLLVVLSVGVVGLLPLDGNLLTFVICGIISPFSLFAGGMLLSYGLAKLNFDMHKFWKSVTSSPLSVNGLVACILLFVVGTVYGFSYL